MTSRTFSERFERLALVMTPIVALATVALSLRAGATSRSRGALVYGAPPAGGRSGIACQIVTTADETGVREIVPISGIDIAASSKGHEAHWHGSTNRDGIGEAWLPLPQVTWGDAIVLTATAEGGETLARGSFVWPESSSRVGTQEAPVRPMQRHGDLWLDVFVNAGRLPPGFESEVLVRARQGASGGPIRDVLLSAVPEPGLSIPQPVARTDVDGWAELRVTADYLLASFSLSASAPSPDSRTGEWQGALPVAPGGAFVRLPSSVPAGQPWPIEVDLANASPRMYVEVDDAAGRDFGGALDVEQTSRGGVARALLPALASGRYWLVTSVDPRGATTLSGGTLARPFLVGDVASSVQRSPELAIQSPPPFTRFLAVDGMARHRGAGDARRRRGLVAALGSLAVAACLEILLVLRASHRAKRQLVALSEATEDAGGAAVKSDFGRAGVMILVLVSLLGFALVAALLLVRSG
jgi:hypothetical protein